MIRRLLTTSYPAFEDFGRRNTSFRGMAAIYGYSLAELRWRNAVRNVSGSEVNGNYFDLLEVQPRLERFFLRLGVQAEQFYAGGLCVHNLAGIPESCADAATERQRCLVARRHRQFSTCGDRDQTFARKMWGESPAIRQHFIIPGDLTEVVGVAEDGKYHDLEEAPHPVVYLPLSQNQEGETITA